MGAGWKIAATCLLPPARSVFALDTGTAFGRLRRGCGCEPIVIAQEWDLDFIFSF